MGPRLPRAGSSRGGRERRRRLRRTSLVVVIPALLLFGVVLLAAALLFAETLDRPTSAGRWAGSTFLLLFATVMVSVLCREVVLRFREAASRRRSHEPLGTHVAAGWRFTPRWKEELRCGSPEGDLILEMMMHEPHVYFPTEGAWARQAPDWAKDRRAELLAALARWCMAEDVPLTVDERAWVVAEAARAGVSR